MKQINLILAMVFICIALTGFVSACDSSYTIPQESFSNITIFCDSDGDVCSSDNTGQITILKPDFSVLVNNVTMGFDTDRFYYQLTEAQKSDLGCYTVLAKVQGTNNAMTSFYYLVTPNGREDPDGIIVIVFAVFFITILAILAYLIINVVLYFVNLKMEKKKGAYKEQLSVFGAKPLVFNLSAYLVLIGYYMLEIYYLSNPIINKFMAIIIFISAISNVILPILAFVISLGFAGWNAVIKSIGGNKYGQR